MLINSSKHALKENARNFLKTILRSTVLSTIELREANEHAALAKG